MNLQNTFKILLVDDDYQIRLAFADFLSDDGHLVTTCENPVQAIELLKKENDFNLIISDFNMPLMTGGDFNQWLIDSSLNIPFILMSGNIEHFFQA
jgi:CheY-like chemotaxis protein